MCLKKINLILIPLTVILIIFRVLHLSLWTDAYTGFSASSIYDIVLYTILGALLLFLVFKIYYSRLTLSFSENKPSKLVCYTVILFAVCCEFMSAVELLGNNQLTYTDNSNIQLIQTIESICAVLGILVGACIVFESVKAMSTSSYVPNLFICCVVIVYFITLLFTFYATHQTMVTVSQNLLGLFFWMSSAVFVCSYLRYLSRVKTALSYKICLISGYFTAICGLIVSIPQITTSFFVDFEFTSFTTIEQLLILPTSVTAAIIVYKLSDTTKEKEFAETKQI